MINWGIIGCGSVTEMKSGPAFNKVGDSKLLAVMRRNRSLAEDYAHRHGVERVYSTAQELIDSKDIDAVYVATPPSDHAHYAIDVIKARKPVYIEKPMAAHYSECVEINKAARKYRVPVFVAYYRRTLPGFLKVRDLIRDGAIGKVRCVAVQMFRYLSEDELKGQPTWHVDPAISGAGHFFDLASHQLDYFDFLFGPVKSVNAITANLSHVYPAEDFISAHFSFENEITVNGLWCFSASKQSARDTIEFIGEKGVIKFSTFSFEPIVLQNENGTQVFENERPQHVQFFLIKSIVEELHGRGKCPSTGISATRTSKVLDAAVKDYYRKIY
jgi:predicted dehydrogenase